MSLDAGTSPKPQTSNLQSPISNRQSRPPNPPPTMPLFRYKALSSTGETLDGQMEAASEREVAARLQDQGHLPIEARSVDAGGEGGLLAGFLRRRDLGPAQIQQFTQQLATLLGAGQPLDRALGILMDLPESEAARRVIARVRETVRGGAPLSSALEQQHGLFSKLYINLVRAGEAGGGLQIALARLADYLERSQALRASVINAMIYPAILMSVVTLTLIVMLAYVVPQFETVFDNAGIELPLISQIVLGLGMIVRDYFWLIVGILAMVGLWLNRRWQEPEWRLRLDTRLLAQRWVGPMLARMETARFARTLGTLLGNGVPLLSALNIAGKVVGNRVLAGAIEEAAEAVKTGNGLAVSLGHRKVVPRLALQMIQVGEESGALDAMLLKVADTFDQETRHALDRMLAALVPALTVFMAVVVGLIIMAILLPLYEMTNSLG